MISRTHRSARPAVRRIALALARQFCLLLAVFIALPSFAAAPPGADLFANGAVLRLQITIPPEGLASLRTNSRKHVTAVLREGTNTYLRVGIHLKGSTGSFRPLDAKPALTVSFDQFAPATPFHGLRKIHLNNSVEDPSYMNELLGGEIFRAAGVPAARVAHALVELNGRRLGLYVLKEGFTEEFLGLHFRQTTGNLYDTGAGHDVDEALEKDLGANPNDRSDLDALVAAAREPDLPTRSTRLQRTLDTDRFLTFMALEIVLGHRDGYSLARNNFRLYHDPESDRLIFLPHGMDQLFGNPRAPLTPKMNGLVARAVMETPEGRRAYRARVGLLMTNVIHLATLHQRIDATLVGLRLALEKKEAKALEQAAATLHQRIDERLHAVEQQLLEPPPEPLRFENGFAPLPFSLWQKTDVPAGGSLVATNAPDGRRALVIHAGPVTAAAWRCRARLPAGRYQFEGAVRAAGVVSLKFGKNHGATLRTGPAVRALPLLGDQPWTTRQVPLEVQGTEEEMEFICELRASQGTAWFAVDSLRLVRLPPWPAQPAP